MLRDVNTGKVGDGGGDALAGLFKMMSRIKDATKQNADLMDRRSANLSSCQDLTTEASDAVLLGFAPPEEAAVAFQATRQADPTAEAHRAEQALRPGPSGEPREQGTLFGLFAAAAGSGRSPQPATWMQCGGVLSSSNAYRELQAIKMVQCSAEVTSGVACREGAREKQLAKLHRERYLVCRL